MAWKWSERRAPEALDNRMTEYPVAAEIREVYERELRTWMRNGWLAPYKEEELGPLQRTEPPDARTAAIQSKSTSSDRLSTARHVDVFIANADVCAAKLREWWQKGSSVSLLDLKRAYLQVRVQKTLWPFQIVKIGGQKYCLTR